MALQPRLGFRKALIDNIFFEFVIPRLCFKIGKIIEHYKDFFLILQINNIDDFKHFKQQFAV